MLQCMPMRRFNTTGICIEGQHYMVPPEPRLPDAPRLIDQGSFFVVHAPRQTGKSTTLRAITNRLTREGRYAAVHFTCETGEVASGDVGWTERLVLGAIRMAVECEGLAPELLPPEPWPTAEPGQAIVQALRGWATACPRPLVLVFDEIDALHDDGLRTVLRQLRDLHQSRPAPGPHSVILCGLRDVRDYKVASGGDPTRLGTCSPFNVKVKSMRVGDFDQQETRSLFAQYAEETGQSLTDEALARVWETTQGQPWLVNALGRELTEEICVPTTEPITADHIEDAKERLILARATHLDSLVARLHEARVQRVIEPILAGDLPNPDVTYDDDVAYVCDLGLIAASDPPKPANPIYREIIVRVLAAGLQRVMIADTPSFVLPGGQLDFPCLLEEFAAFWKEHGETLVSSVTYH